jgi:hypothetical protein
MLACTYVFDQLDYYLSSRQQEREQQHAHCMHNAATHDDHLQAISSSGNEDQFAIRLCEPVGTCLPNAAACACSTNEGETLPLARNSIVFSMQLCSPQFVGRAKLGNFKLYVCCYMLHTTEARCRMSGTSVAQCTRWTSGRHSCMRELSIRTNNTSG